MADLLRDANGLIVPQYYDRKDGKYIPISIRNVDGVNIRDTYLNLDNSGKPFEYQYLDKDGTWVVYRTANLPQGASTYPNIVSKVIIERVGEGLGVEGPKGDKGDTGSQGPKGDKGDTGSQGPKGDVGSSGSNGTSAAITGATASIGTGTGTPSVNVTLGGNSTNRTFNFSFNNLKGPKGDKGDPGSGGSSTLPGIVADGVFDNSSILQNAINNLNSLGGGVIRLPSGAIKINNIRIKENVKLIGNDKKTTTLLVNTSPSVIMESNTEVREITFKGDSSTFVGDWQGCIQMPNGTGQIVDSCEFKNLYTCVYNQNASHFEVKNSKFSCDATAGYGFYGEISKHSFIDNNFFDCTATDSRPICFQFFAQNNKISNNTIIGNNKAITGILFMNHYDNYYASVFGNRIVGNYVSGVTEEGISFDMMMESDRMEDRWTGGSVTSASLNIYSNSLVDENAEWWPGGMYMRYVLITKGKGVGQYRLVTSNTATSLTIDKPWSVLPDATSSYIIGSFGFDNIMSHNVVENCGRQGLLLYGTNLTSQIVNNVVNNCGINPDTTVYEWSGIGVVTCEANEVRRYRPALFNLVANNTVSYGKTGIVICSAPWSGTYTPVMLPSNTIVKGNNIQDMPTGIWIREGEKSIVSENSVFNVTSSIKLGVNTNAIKCLNNLTDVSPINEGSNNSIS